MLAGLLFFAAISPPATALLPDPTSPSGTLPVVAVLDSGIAMSHPQFAPNQVVGWKDFVNDRPQPYDDLGHGTMVASRVGGLHIGSYPGAKLLIGKVLDDANLATWGAVARGIDWAVANGADVVNVSIWSQVPAPLPFYEIDRAIERATVAGVLVVWIAGNGGPAPSTLGTGSGARDALVVGAANADGSPASFSQLDPELLAPGVNVLVAGSWSEELGRGSGTSFAAPWVAGIAARLIADGAPRDPEWLAWVLLHSATDDPSISYPQEGYGFLGADAVQRARAVAQGETPYPAADDRDMIHTATETVRSARAGNARIG